MTEETGGTDWELRVAEDGIVSAESRGALALAMRRHVEAQRNMMQAVMVPSFVDAVGRLMDRKTAELAGGQAELLQELRELRTALTKHDQRVSRLSKRVTALERRVARLEERERVSGEA